MRSQALRILAVVLFISGLYDVFAGGYYSFLVGADLSVSDPPTHRFYALFIASFLFCFAYLQIASAFNVRRYLLNVGVIVVGRTFYAVLLLGYVFGPDTFPTTFLPTAFIDIAWSVLYIALAAISDEVRVGDLFIPRRTAAPQTGV